MNEYLMLYVFAFGAVIFAVIQDIKTREIANWLTFSLIAFVLSYRAFYSVYFSDWMFFLHGLFGVVLFIILGYLFYYARIFAGGDAKLLFGIGGVFPYNTLMDYFYFGGGFLMLLFASGAFYTLIYSLFLAFKERTLFAKSFRQNIFKIRFYFIACILFSLLYFVFSGFNFILDFLISAFILLVPLIFAYAKAIEGSCMIKLVSAQVLTEGDWLERDVVVNGKKIKKNFSGLTYEEILLLRKHGKKVWVKTGVPFAPAFLIALILFLWYSSF